MKKIMFVLIASIISINLYAIDIKAIGGFYMPRKDYIKNYKPIGLEIGGVTSPRDNGLNYGIKTGIVGHNSNFNDGSFAYLNVEIIYRSKRAYEMYVAGGTTFQNISNKDYGAGYNYGLGLRRTWCNGILLGVEFLEQDLTLNASSIELSAQDGEDYKNHAILASFGYRFK